MSALNTAWTLSKAPEKPDTPVVEASATRSSKDSVLESSAEVEKSAKEGKKEEEEEEEPKTLQQWLQKQTNEEWTEYNSFYKLFVNQNKSTLLVAAHVDAIDPKNPQINPLFFVNISVDGREGGFRDCWNATPKDVGLKLVRAPESNEVWLCEEQHTGRKTDLAASMRSYEDGTLPLGGFIVSMAPLVELEDHVLLDLTSWFFSFSSVVGRGGYDLPMRNLQTPGNSWERAVVNADRSLFAHVNENICTQCCSGSQRQPDYMMGEKSTPAPISTMNALESSMRIDEQARGKGLMGGGGGFGIGTKLLKVLGFPQNFVLKFCNQSGTAPLKGLGPPSLGQLFGGPPPDLTQYFSVCFAELPHRAMPPRRWDRRVGYFTTPVTVNGEDRVTQRQNAINRWYLERRNNKVVFHVDPSIPKPFRKHIKEATESWNIAFNAAGRGPKVVYCVCPEDPEWPADYNTGDTRFNPIVMTETFVLGYGPSIVDFRSGEILHAAIVLGFSTFVSSASTFEEDILLGGPGGGYTKSGGLLSAFHPNVILNVQKTVCHEVGHALGLRHNFMGAQDGNSSVMDYEDMWDTTLNGKAIFGGHFLVSPGKYDLYAIKYGYTPIQEEWDPKLEQNTSWADGYHSLALLANGQSVPVARAGVRLRGAQDPKRIELSQPANPLFATDECVSLDGGDPRVTRWEAPDAPLLAGIDKISYAIRQRQHLLKMLKSGKLRGGHGPLRDGSPGVYANMIHRSIGTAVHAVVVRANVLGGAMLDAGRELAKPVQKPMHMRLLSSCTEVLVGPLLRLSSEEAQHLIEVVYRGSYALAPTNCLALHSAACRRILNTVTNTSYLYRLEDQRSSSRSADLMDTCDLLLCLAFKNSHLGTDALLYPFTIQDGQNSTVEPAPEVITRAGEDGVRSQARLEFAKVVSNLAQLQNENAQIAAGARTFIELTFKSILGEQSLVPINQFQEADILIPMKESAIPKSLRNASPRARASWLLFLQRMVHNPSSKGGGGGFPFFRFGDIGRSRL